MNFDGSLLLSHSQQMLRLFVISTGDSQMEELISLNKYESIPGRLSLNNLLFGK